MLVYLNMLLFDIQMQTKPKQQLQEKSIMKMWQNMIDPKNSQEDHHELRVGKLARKLNMHNSMTNISTTPHFTSPCPSRLIVSKEQSLRLKIHKQEQLFEQECLAIEEHIQDIFGLHRGHVEEGSIANLYSNNLLKNIIKVIQQIKSAAEKPTKAHPLRELNPFTSILNKINTNTKILPQRQNKSRKNTVNTVGSVIKDKDKDSLLMSFKKMIDDEEELTFKYSDQSNLKHKERSSQSVWENYQFQQKVKNKNKITQQQQYESYFNMVKNQAANLYNVQKEELKSHFEEGSKAIEAYENVLDKIVEEIAQEKVQSEDNWKDILTLSQVSLIQLRKEVKQMKEVEDQLEEELSNRLSEVQQNLNGQTSNESMYRKTQQKQIIRLINEMLPHLA